MADFNKFDIFVQDLAHGEHKLQTHQLKLAFCAAANAPVAANALLANLTAIATTNIDDVNLTLITSEQTAGVYKICIEDKLLTATDTVPAFKYIVIYNSAATVKTNPLIGWYAYPADQVLYVGDTFTINFDDANGVFTIT
jgi:hypothetical protein